jgi:hypothetical protein
MGLTLQLTRNVLNTFVGWKAQVLHDLHESVPYLYDNTVGDGPYNAWIDPMLADEWADDGLEQRLRDDQIRHARRLHARHVRYLVAELPDVHRGMHNGISRLYETFGNGGADTEERILRPTSTPARGSSRIRRCRRPNGRSATTIITKRPACSPRWPIFPPITSSSCTISISRRSGPSRSPRPKGRRHTSSPPTIRAPARRPTCSACCRTRAAKFPAPASRSPS